MFSKLKIRKVAWVLLLVALFSLIPTNTFKVFADGTIVPPFPYDELQTIGENDYVLFKVHGIDEVDFVECINPGSPLHGTFDMVLPGLSYFKNHIAGIGGWQLQINTIDYYFKNGVKIDFDLQSLFTSSFISVKVPNEHSDIWLEPIYSTSDVWGIDEDDLSGYGIKFFMAQNFIVEAAATPTPTPEAPSPTPELDEKFPTFTYAYRNNQLNNNNRAVTKYLVCNRYYDENNTRYEYKLAFVWQRFNPYLFGVDPLYTPSYNGYDYSSGVATFYFPNIAPNYNWTGQYSLRSFNSDNYLTFEDVYDCSIDTQVYPSLQMVESSVRNYQFSINDDSLIYEGTAIYSINTDGTCNRLDGQGGEGGSTPTATPTPTSAPTPIPQPSVTPEPDDPDETSSWGWGIVNTLKYIFIPDKNKLIRLEKTAQTRFQQFGGGYDDLKRVSGFEDPVRPQNVVMNWQPFGTNSPEQQQQITIVDFEQIDFYLFETSSGMFIKDCLSASFTFLMFGYLIHVIRKHFVVENNTSDESDGGGD